MTQNLSSSALVKPAVKDAQAEADIPAPTAKRKATFAERPGVALSVLGNYRCYH